MTRLSNSLAKDVGTVFGRLSRLKFALERHNVPFDWVTMPVTLTEWSALAEYLGYPEHGGRFIIYLGIKIPKPDERTRAPSVA